MIADEFNVLLGRLGWSTSFPAQAMPLDSTRAEETNVYRSELLGPVGAFWLAMVRGSAIWCGIGYLIW
jgi:hypothetical protein